MTRSLRAIFRCGLGAWMAGCLWLGLVVETDAAAPFGHCILAKRLAEKIAAGQVPGAPPELVAALQDPETIRYFCGGAVAPDLQDTWTHHDGRPQKLGDGLMQSARDLTEKAQRTGSVQGKETARQELAFAYGWLSHCAVDLTVHPKVNAAQGDAFSYTSPLKQGLHGNMESDMDAYIYKFDRKPGEKYDPAFPPDGYLQQKLGLTQNELDEGRNALVTKAAAELGMKNPEAKNLSPEDYQTKWSDILQRAEWDTVNFIGSGRLPGDWDLDCGRISSKDFRQLHNQVAELNGGKVPDKWGGIYLNWFEQVRNLSPADRAKKLAQLLGLATQRVPCLATLDAKLQQAAAARAAAATATQVLKTALQSVATLGEAAKKINDSPQLPADMRNAAALIQSATRTDSEPVFEQLQPLGQTASTAQQAACKATDAATAQSQATAAAAAATTAQTIAQPVVDACQAIRGQLQAQKNLARTILVAQQTAKQIPGWLTLAEAALPKARQAVADLAQAQQDLDAVSTDIYACHTEAVTVLAPLTNDSPIFTAAFIQAESAAASCLNWQLVVSAQNNGAGDKVAAAEAEINRVKAKLAELPDYDALAAQWLAVTESSRDYLAGAGAVEAWLVRIQRLADLARKCGTRTNTAPPAPTPAPAPAPMALPPGTPIWVLTKVEVDPNKIVEKDAKLPEYDRENWKITANSASGMHQRELGNSAVGPMMQFSVTFSALPVVLWPGEKFDITMTMKAGPEENISAYKYHSADVLPDGQFGFTRTPADEAERVGKWLDDKFVANQQITYHLVVPQDLTPPNYDKKMSATIYLRTGFLGAIAVYHYALDVASATTPTPGNPGPAAGGNATGTSATGSPTVGEPAGGRADGSHLKEGTASPTLVSTLGEPSPPPINAAAALVARGQAAFTNGLYAEALPLFEQAAQQMPDDASIQVALGRVHNTLGNLDAALAAYQTAFRLTPQTPNLRAWTGELYLHKGDYPAAARWLNEEVAANPGSAWAQSFLGTLYLQTGDAASSQRAFRRAMELDPNTVQYRHQNGHALATQRQFARALTEFLSAAYLDPNYEAAYYGAATCYAALGQRAPAIEGFERYLRLDSTSEWAALARQELQRLRSQP